MRETSCPRETSADRGHGVAAARGGCQARERSTAPPCLVKGKDSFDRPLQIPHVMRTGPRTAHHFLDDLDQTSGDLIRGIPGEGLPRYGSRLTRLLREQQRQGKIGPQAGIVRVRLDGTLTKRDRLFRSPQVHGRDGGLPRHVGLVGIDPVGPRKPRQPLLGVAEPLVDLLEQPHRRPVTGVDPHNLDEQRNSLLQTLLLASPSD